MKLLSLIGCCIFFTSAWAQTIKVDVLKNMNRPGVLKPFRNNIFLEKIHQDTLIKKFQAPLVGKKIEPGIYYMPQDNMPCLVPDVRDLAAIPNGWPNVQLPFKSGIPNPGLPQQPLPEPQRNKTK